MITLLVRFYSVNGTKFVDEGVSVCEKFSTCVCVSVIFAFSMEQLLFANLLEENVFLYGFLSASFLKQVCVDSVFSVYIAMC